MNVCDCGIGWWVTGETADEIAAVGCDLCGRYSDDEATMLAAQQRWAVEPDRIVIRFDGDPGDLWVAGEYVARLDPTTNK